MRAVCHRDGRWLDFRKLCLAHAHTKFWLLVAPPRLHGTQWSACSPVRRQRNQPNPSISHRPPASRRACSFWAGVNARRGSVGPPGIHHRQVTSSSTAPVIATVSSGCAAAAEPTTSTADRAASRSSRARSTLAGFISSTPTCRRSCGDFRRWLSPTPDRFRQARQQSLTGRQSLMPAR